MAVTADYTQLAFGPWQATVTAEHTDLAPRVVRGLDAHEAVHGVLDELAALAEELDLPLATIHQLRGDPTAFVELAHREGFADCVAGVQNLP